MKATRASIVSFLFATSVLFGASSPCSAYIVPYVRPATAGEFTNNDWHWNYYPPFTQHPDTPPQSSFYLTVTDPLALVVPSGDSPGHLAYRDFTVSRYSNRVMFTVYILYTGITTATVYGPTDMVFASDPLPADTYQLMIRTVEALDGFPDLPTPDFAAFCADPVSYTSNRAIRLQVNDLALQYGGLSFTVVPEPTSLALLLSSALLLLRNRRSRRDQRSFNQR